MIWTVAAVAILVVAVVVTLWAINRRVSSGSGGSGRGIQIPGGVRAAVGGVVALVVGVPGRCGYQRDDDHKVFYD